MKKLGLIGGLGPESTKIYYDKITKRVSKLTDGKAFPEIALYSFDLIEFLELAMNDQWDLIAERVAAKINAIEQLEADFAAIASNTPHKVIDQIKSLTNIPIISIVDATVSKAVNENCKKAILLGTMFTMNSDFYQKEFEKKNIEIIVPTNAEKQFIHEKIFSELQNGIVLQETKDSFLKIINRLILEEKADCVLLACTELPLIIHQDDLSILTIDTTEEHIQVIVNQII